MLACQPSTLTQRSMHHQKSSSDSPFQANTATPRRRRGASLAPAEFGTTFCLGKPQTRRTTQGPKPRISPTYPSLKDIGSEPFLRQGLEGMLPHGSAPLTCFCQGSCHLVLGGVDVAGRPAALRPQCTQRLNQHLWDRGLSREGPSTACCSAQPGMERGEQLRQTLPRENAGSRTSVRGCQECGGAFSKSPMEESGEKVAFPTLDAQIRSHSPQSVL